MKEVIEPQETAISRMLRKLPQNAPLECYPVGDFLVINGHVEVRAWLEAAADDLTEEDVIRRYATPRDPDPVELAYPHITPRLGKPYSTEELKALFFGKDVTNHEFLETRTKESK